MSFLDFFKKKVDNGSDNQNVPPGNPSGKSTPNSHLNTLMGKMYQQSRERAKVAPTSRKPKRIRRDVESNGEGIGFLEALFDMEGHRMPDIGNNISYGFEEEDFALLIPRPEPDLEKGRKLYDMGMKKHISCCDWKKYEEEEGWMQKCHLLFCSYMFGYEPALNEYQQLREKCRARYRQLSGKIDDYSLLADLRHPARSFALGSCFNSEHFARVWNTLLGSRYGQELEERWDRLVEVLKTYRIQGPKNSFSFYSKYVITLDDDIERIWMGVRKELMSQVCHLCPLDEDDIDKICENSEGKVFRLLVGFSTTLNALNAMYDKVFEAVWENPLNLYYNTEVL